MIKLKNIILEIYLNKYIIIDLLLIVLLSVILYFIDYPYMEISELLALILWLPTFFITTNSEKINRIKKSKIYSTVFWLYIMYFSIYMILIYMLKNINIVNLVVFNILIAILITTFFRLFVFGSLLLKLYLSSKNK